MVTATTVNIKNECATINEVISFNTAIFLFVVFIFIGTFAYSCFNFSTKASFSKVFSFMVGSPHLFATSIKFLFSFKFNSFSACVAFIS